MTTAEQLGFGQTAKDNIYNTSGKYTDAAKQANYTPSDKGQSRADNIVINSPLGKTGPSRRNNNSGGWQNVADVFTNIATLQPITANTGSTAGDIAVGLTAQSLGTAALGFGALATGAAAIDAISAGIVAAGSSSAAAAGGLTATGTTAASSTPSWLIPAAAGVGAGFLLFGQGKQEQQSTHRGKNWDLFALDVLELL